MSRRRNLFNRVFSILLAIFCTTGYAANIPRGADGKPDLNGTWQVMNRANYDLQIHAARAAMALRDGPFGPVPAKEVVALGAVGAVPAGLGVVVGGEIPYQEWAYAIRRSLVRRDSRWRPPDRICPPPE